MATTYKKSGVDIKATDRLLERLSPTIRTTHGPGVLPDLGQFAGLFELSKRWRDPVLVASTDGVGTKLKVAQLVGDYSTLGIDAVAMNVNDVLVYGAQPLFFLDYIAIGKVRPAIMAPLVRGMVQGCRQSGCALLGGETAEMPGVYRNGDFDVAGFCVGVVERRKLLDSSQVRSGDVIIGLASSGVHANGFSLVRRVLSRTRLHALRRPLLRPTRIYVKPVLEVLRRVPVHALVHVTGGGLARRLPRLAARHRRLNVVVVPESWPVPPIFRTIQAAGSVSDEDMMHTFNMGIGMALACRERDQRQVIRILQHAGVPAWAIGVIL